MSDGQHAHAPDASTKPETSSKGPLAGRLGPALVGGIAGFVLGFVVASASRPRADATLPSAASAAALPSVSAGPVAPGLKGGPAEVAFDFGVDGTDQTLRGNWARANIRPHSAVQTEGPEGAIKFVLNPQAAPYGLGVLAAAVGIGPDDSLDVGVRLNEQKLASWKVRSDWDMQGVVLPPGALVPGENVLELTIPRASGEHKPMLALDSLHLGPLLPSAEASLDGVGVRGSLIRGYYGREGEGSQVVTWSAGLRSRVGFFVGPSSADYDLTLHGYAFGPLQPLEVEALVNTRSVGKAKVDKGPSTIFRVPAGALKQGLNVVEFVYPKSVKPSDTVKGSQDQRELAIRIGTVALAPVTPVAPAPASAAPAASAASKR